jgi:hypothetical protein
MSGPKNSPSRTRSRWRFLPTQPISASMTKNMPKLEAAQAKDGSWSVLLTHPYERKAQIDGFETEAEVKAWIVDKSAAWLQIYEGGVYAPTRKRSSTAE